jgi:hypothetical protein
MRLQNAERRLEPLRRLVDSLERSATTSSERAHELRELRLELGDAALGLV